MTIYDIYAGQSYSDRERAMEYAEIFLERIDSTVVHPVAARMGVELAEWYEMDKFLFSKAIRWRERSLSSYRALEDGDNVAANEYHLAKLYLKKGQYHKTLKYVTSATRAFEDRKDTLGLIECYKLLGVVYETCRDYDRANEYFQAYTKLARIMDDSTRLFIGLNNAAAFASNLGDTVKVVKLLSESIELATRSGNTSWLCKLYMNAASANTSSGNFDEAEKYFNLALPLLGTIEQKGHFYLNYGSLHLKKGDTDKAIRSLNESVSYYEQGEFDLILKTVYGILNDLYTESGDIDNAYRTLLAIAQLHRKIAPNEVLIELFSTQNDIQLMQEREKMQNYRNRQTLIFTIIFFLIMVAALIAWLIFRKRSYDIRRREEEIATRNEISEIKRMQQYRMDRITEETIKKLNDLGRNVKEGAVRNQIGRICRDLQRSKDDESWKEVSRYIPEFNSEFYRKLTVDFPNLTNNESRICVLISQNLSTKEISEITRQTPESINIARTRLRKKLGLTGNDLSLTGFLRKYNS